MNKDLTREHEDLIATRQAYREYVFNEVKAALAEKTGNTQLVRLRYRKPSLLKRILKYGQRLIS